MNKSSNSNNLFIWNFEPKFSFGVLIAFIIISGIFVGLWQMFSQIYIEHKIFAFIHHLLGFLTFSFMFIASWASPGRLKKKKNPLENIQEEDHSQTDHCIVEIGNKNQTFNFKQKV